MNLFFCAVCLALSVSVVGVLVTAIYAVRDLFDDHVE